MDTNPNLGIYPHRTDPQRCMIRLKLPGGTITPDQLTLAAKIIGDDGAADLTTRQELQLYGIASEQVEATLGKLREAGLSTLGAGGKTVRNIVGCPLAGARAGTIPAGEEVPPAGGLAAAERQELFDVSPVITQLHDFFLGNAQYAELPNALRLSVSACADQCVQPALHDLSLVGSQAGFDLWVGGSMAQPPSLGRPLGIVFKAEEALEVVRAAIDVWRLVPESWSDPARVRAELQGRLGRPLESAPESAAPDEAFRDHVGVHAQRAAGQYAVGIPIFAGHATGAQLDAIADLARRWSPAPLIRLTPRQNIVLLNVPELSVSRVLEGLTEVELSINAHPIRRGLLTCVGTEQCPSSVAGTTARARQIVNYLEERIQLDAPLRLGISGCANACGQHPIAHIGLSAAAAQVDGHAVDGFDLWLGGQLGKAARLGRVVLNAVPANECAKRLEQLLRTFKDKRKGAEPFNAFCARVGDAEVARLLTELPKKRDDEEDAAPAVSEAVN